MKPGFSFQLSFFPRSVTNRRLGSTAHASLMHAYDTWNLQKLSSCKATSSDAMIYRAMKSHANEHTVRGRPTLNTVKRFREGSVCKAYERSTIYERTFWVTLSRIMLYCVSLFQALSSGTGYAVLCQGASYQPGLSTLHLDKKHLQKRHRIFRRDREPSRIPARTRNVCATRKERLDNMFLLFTNVSVRVHL